MNKINVAFVVVALADEPTEDSGRIGRIGDAAVVGLAVPCGDIVSGDGAPESLCRINPAGPSFDAGKETFDARPVAPESYVSVSWRLKPLRPGLVAMGTVIEPVPVTLVCHTAAGSWIPALARGLPWQQWLQP